MGFSSAENIAMDYRDKIQKRDDAAVDRRCYDWWQMTGWLKQVVGWSYLIVCYYWWFTIEYAVVQQECER